MIKSKDRKLKVKPFKIRLRQGDNVMIRSGKFKGRTGKILAVYPKLNKVTVEGINVATRHRKPTAENPQAGSLEVTRPLAVSKVGLYDSSAKKASRVGYQISSSGKKSRVMKTSGKEIRS